jgi:type II secretory pathway component GspD/PulD (secretin)
MKTKIAVAICFGATLAIGLGRAQENPATDSSAPIQDSPARVAEVLPLVQFDDAPLVDVIKTLARQASLNIIFDPRVTAPGGADGQSAYPPVSIRLENVTAEAVLEATLNNNNLRLERDLRTGISRVTVKDPAAAEPLQMEIFQLKYTNPSNLVSIIKPTMEGRSQAIPDGRTSQLIVWATENEILTISNLIANVDTATRQVLIEARILETTRNPETIKGVNWAGTFQEQNVYAGNNAYGMSQSSGGSSSSGGTEQPLNAPIAPGITPGLAAFMRSGFQHPVAYLNADGARAVFSFFNQDSESETLATPRAVTADNEAAELLVTKAVPIFRVTQGGTQVGNSVDVTYTNVGIILNVTPRISANDTIALRVEPEVSSKGDKATFIQGGEVYTADEFDIRKITTQVTIPSGNTLVLGGLLSDNTTKRTTKVPVLGDLPGLKYLFGSKQKSRRKSNLLIFVTPTVVQDGDFTPADSTFLQTPVPLDPDAKEMGSFDEPWDGVEPYDWGEPVY